jgi:flagellar P-ring protein precursor FlgI
VTKSINSRFPNTAKAVDSATIQVKVPIKLCRNVPDFISEIGVLQVTPDAPARIVINERTGTVIVGQRVQISAVAIAHGNLVIKPNGTVVPTPDGILPPPDGGPASPRPIPSRPALLLPPPPSRDEDEELDDLLAPPLLTPPPGNDQPSSFHIIEPTYTVAELARVLNLLGVSPRDLIAIFQALKESGALHAELVIM